MNPMNLFLACCLLTVALVPVHAAEPTPGAPPPSRATALPPPALGDKGVPADVTSSTDASLEPAMPDTRLVRDRASRDREEAIAQIRSHSDSVTRRQEGDDAVEEYREKGKLRMVRIIPRTGPEQIYMDNNNDGRLERDPRDGPVAPVYFTIYQWD